jgi:hypothetical protein
VGGGGLVSEKSGRVIGRLAVPREGGRLHRTRECGATTAFTLIQLRSHQEPEEPEQKRMTQESGELSGEHQRRKLLTRRWQHRLQREQV